MRWNRWLAPIGQQAVMRPTERAVEHLRLEQARTVEVMAAILAEVRALNQQIAWQNRELARTRSAPEARGGGGGL